MLDIEIISINKPDLKTAAELLGPIVREIWDKEQKEKVLSRQQQPNQPKSGVSVA
jgi:hypothetical protein